MGVRAGRLLAAQAGLQHRRRSPLQRGADDKVDVMAVALPGLLVDRNCGRHPARDDAIDTGSSERIEDLSGIGGKRLPAKLLTEDRRGDGGAELPAKAGGRHAGKQRGEPPAGLPRVGEGGHRVVGAGQPLAPRGLGGIPVEKTGAQEQSAPRSRKQRVEPGAHPASCA